MTIARKKARPGARRTARVALSRERIVDAALALVEGQGFAALSTRRLGESLGCEAMSIYHHFPSKQHLLDGMVDRVVEGFALPPPGPSPVERLRRTCLAYRDLAHRHPRFFPYVAVHRLNTPSGVRFVDGVLGVVQALVPDRELAARYFRVLGYYLVGGALDETSGYAAGPSAAEPVSDAYVAAHCPHLAAAAPWFRAAQWDATFALGLDALLAQMQRRA
jgi:AcrR family transcriptional regulator